jgi:hexulose-6-phosphate isomerase
MNSNNPLSRRNFLKSTAAVGSVAIAHPSLSLASTPTDRLLQDDDPSLSDRILKTLKIGMVKVEGSLTEKFKAAKTAGFAGIEMDSPGMNVDETKKAILESGLPVDGTVCSTHWQIRHSSPKAEERATALEHLNNAIRDTHAVGGNSVLLVVGHGKDGTEEEVWDRSFENIAQAIPTCARYGIHIVIENVWNHFLYDHNGDHTQTADKFVKYVDQFESPWVGMQFDIGNHRKYGNMADWIRTLGNRVHKLDLKGYNRGTQKWASIGQGDIDWADVRKALVEINYYGWAAAEVGGGNLERLQEISANMDKVFNLT